MHFKGFVLLTFLFLGPITANAGAIHDAAKKDDFAGIAAALDGGADANENDGLVTPLYIAAIRGKPVAVELLIERGADANLPTQLGTPLHAAAKAGCLACVKLLVEAGADVNALTPKREPAVHIAKKFGYSEVADYLLKHGHISPVPPPISAKLISADLIKGKSLFLRGCAGCHDDTANMGKRHGPPLWGIVGRPRASIAEFKYSQSLMEAGGSWNYEGLNGFISDPRSYLPGTEMEAEGYQNTEDRADLIAYLRSLSENPDALPKE
jgi:cytochrome c